MVTNSEISLFSDLKPYKTTWKVEIKVLHWWEQHSNYPGGDTYEFILEDKMGFNIHCTCKKLFLTRVKKLQVGQWRFLENFSVYPVTGIYRRTNHKYKIFITDNSIVTNSSLTNCEVIFSDHSPESSSEDISTSFFKCKEIDAHLNDMNSTSKKLCAKNIKTEKTKED